MRYELVMYDCIISKNDEVIRLVEWNYIMWCLELLPLGFWASGERLVVGDSPAA